MSFKHIPFGSPEEFNVVVEIPAGSANKYEYNEDLDVMTLDFVFTGGLRFPFNYGYVPRTRGGDGDALDVIVLNSESIHPGTVVACRAIGMIELLDRGEEDNKIIAVPVKSNAYENIRSIEDIPAKQVNGFREFFKEVGVQKKKTIEIKNIHGRDRAIKEVTDARQHDL